jgi:hypothetical protein
MKPSPAMPPTAAIRTPDWRCRHGAAVLCADAIRSLADDAADALVHLSQCEGEPVDLQRALVALRAQLTEAERLCECFDCADRHAAEAPDR